MTFSKDFLWGVSESGFQFEMGDPEGKSIDPNTDWYVWVHDAFNIKKGIVSGNLPEKGINNWNLYKQDHAIAKELGLNAYRIGIEWSRIFPKNTSSVKVEIERASDGNIARIEVDESVLKALEKIANIEAVSHYRQVIEDLRSNDFQVFVCLNHFTLPLWIHDPIIVRKTRLLRGPKGWIDENTIVEFTKYAAFMAWKLGDIVDNWATFNEPGVIPETGYIIAQSGFPPGVNNFRASRKAARHLVIAHARAYDAIKKFDTIKADKESGSPANVGLIHNVIPARPFSPSRKPDADAAKFMDNMHNHFFIQSLCDGWLNENLSGIKQEKEIKNYLGQRLDWIGVNYYTRFVVKGRKFLLAKIFVGIPVIPQIVENYGFGCKPAAKSAEGLPTTDSGWEVYPEGLLEALNAMKKYGKPLYVTENGLADERDALRSRFITEHLKVLEKAVSEEKIDVRGYFHWALTDNYEWAQGFGKKFGLCTIDLQTKLRRRRASAETYSNIVNKEK